MYCKLLALQFPRITECVIEYEISVRVQTYLDIYPKTFSISIIIYVEYDVDFHK